MASISFSASGENYMYVNISQNATTLMNNYRLFVNGSLYSNPTFPQSTSHSAQPYIGGLSPSTGYTVSVYYYYNSTLIGSGAQSQGQYYTKAPPPPPVPSPATIYGFSYGNPNAYVPTTVTASYYASGATSYNVQCLALGINTTTSSTTYSFTVYGAGSYNFTVYPMNGAGTGPGDSRTFYTYNAPDTTPPSSNGYYQVTSVTETSIQIYADGATDASSGMAGYRVYYKVGTGTSGLTHYTTIYGSNGYATINGLTEGTQYTVAIQTFDNAGNYRSDYTSGTVTTVASVPSAPTVQTRIDGGFVMQWGAISGATHYQLDYKPSVNSVWQSVTVTATSTTLNLNQWGLQYDFRVRATKDNGSTWGSYSGTNSATTNPMTPSLSGNYVGTSANLTVSISNSNYSVLIVDRYLRSNGSLVDSLTTTTNGGTVSWTIAEGSIGLYYFRARSRLDVSGTSLYSLGTSNNVQFDRPQNFTWTFPKTAGDPVKVGADEWNAFAQRVNSFRAYKIPNQGSYTFTWVYSGNLIRATYINEARNAINSMNPSASIPDYCSAEITDISAYYFNQLVKSLNSVT